MITYSLYQYLSFVLPGALVLFTSYYGAHGWTYGEPGASAAIGITAAAFVVGHVAAALGSLLQPLAWLHRPGSNLSSMEGLFGRRGSYTEGERAAIQERMESLFGERFELQTLFDLSYTRLQDMQRDAALRRLNEDLGFYRNMGAATLVSLVVVGIYSLTSTGGYLPFVLWGPAYAAALAFFVYRFRRFWRRFGKGVVRGTITNV